MPDAHAGRLVDHILRGVRPDPDGTNVEAVYHGPVERSAASVVLSWDE